jgi:hypothetical protein
MIEIQAWRWTHGSSGLIMAITTELEDGWDPGTWSCPRGRIYHLGVLLPDLLACVMRLILLGARRIDAHTEAAMWTVCDCLGVWETPSSHSLTMVVYYVLYD